MLIGLFPLYWDELHLFAFEHIRNCHVRVLLLALSNHFDEHRVAPHSSASVSDICFKLVKTNSCNKRAGMSYNFDDF